MYLVLKKCPYTVLLIFLFYVGFVSFVIIILFVISYYLLTSIFGLHQHKHQITADKRGKQLKIFPYGWKKSDMVGKLQWMECDMVGNFPQGARKSVPSHRTFSLVHPSYRREFPILFSISAVNKRSLFLF